MELTNIATGSFVTAMSTTVHENPDVFGEQPREFNGFQWAETGKEAIMTGPAHIVFGLGRFACPGRVLAVNGECAKYSPISRHSRSYDFPFRFHAVLPAPEINLIVMCLIARSTPTLLEGKFEVADPLNTVRVRAFVRLMFDWGAPAHCCHPAGVFLCSARG